MMKIQLILLCCLSFSVLAKAEFPKLKNPIQKAFGTADKAFSIITGWTQSPETGEDVLATQLTYKAQFNKKQVRWMQIARVQNNDDSDYDFKGFQEDRNLNRTADGYYMDQNYDICKEDRSKCSYFYRDHFENPDESVEENNIDQMADFPFGWSLFKRIRLESCAYNLVSQKYEGCILWGAEWPPIGERVTFDPVFQSQPSATFQAALLKYKTFYNLK